MIKNDSHSNLTILSDGIKDNFENIYLFADFAASWALDYASNRDEQVLLKIGKLKSKQRFSELNCILYCSFFLESYINMFDYVTNATDVNYKFEKFSNMPTQEKWRSHFPQENDFLELLRDLFDYRNFLVHSKPCRRSGGISQVFVKSKGWIVASEISTYITNDMGLIVEHLPMSAFKKAEELINKSVALVLSKNDSFNDHYNYLLDFENAQNLDDINKSFNDLFINDYVK